MEQATDNIQLELLGLAVGLDQVSPGSQLCKSSLQHIQLVSLPRRICHTQGCIHYAGIRHLDDPDGGGDWLEDDDTISSCSVVVVVVVVALQSTQVDSYIVLIVLDQSTGALGLMCVYGASRTK